MREPGSWPNYAVPQLEGWSVGVEVGLVAFAFGGDGVGLLLAAGVFADGHGQPAPGKSTVAVAVERALVESGHVAYLLDGDNLRHGLSDDLGFSAGDRAENIRRVGHLTRLLADAGVIALASLVSPLKSDRQIARALNEAAKLPYLEVYVSTSLAECEKRDPKGLYARARSGALKGMTGVDAPYEPPEDADLVLDTTGADIDALVAQVIELLDKTR
jgi:bifunctional enzyme CysN/CysC